MRNLTPQKSKSTTPFVSRFELGTMLEYMKAEILHSLAMQMDTMQLKMKMEEAKKSLIVFFPKCRKNHEKNEWPSNYVEVYGIFTDKHPIDKFPFLPPLKSILIG